MSSHFTATYSIIIYKSVCKIFKVVKKFKNLINDIDSFKFYVFTYLMNYFLCILLVYIAFVVAQNLAYWPLQKIIILKPGCIIFEIEKSYVRIPKTKMLIFAKRKWIVFFSRFKALTSLVWSFKNDNFESGLWCIWKWHVLGLNPPKNKYLALKIHPQKNVAFQDSNPGSPYKVFWDKNCIQLGKITHAHWVIFWT